MLICINAGISCYLSRSLDNGKVTALSNTYQSVAHYQCDDGYTLFGPSTRKCLITSTWSGYTPVCVANNVTEGESFSYKVCSAPVSIVVLC